jgi:hypothetical protein
MTDRRIALAAVIVSGVIGVTGPLITWRAAISGQKASSRDERARDDLADLRAVLDASLRDLNRLRTVLGPEMVAWEYQRPRRIYLARHLMTSKTYAQAQSNTDRLAIRVGTENQLWQTYNTAVGNAHAASLYMYGNQFGEAHTQEFVRLANKSNRAEIRFRAEALEAAGTNLKRSRR